MASRKKKKTYEIVTACDQCGIGFSLTYCRTAGSAVCASGNGIVARNYGEWKFFCCKECDSKYR